MDCINSFSDVHFFLSNFYAVDIMMDGWKFPSVEHAYQGAKTLNLDQRIKFTDIYLRPGKAKQLGKNVDLRSDWEHIKLRIMNELVFQKFDNHELKQKLLDTYPLELIEGNWWGDKFWGVCNGEGHNHLGKILMNKRNQLRSQSFYEGN